MPLVTEERVIGVLVAATTHERRVFGSEDIALLEALASEAALALERTRSADALAQAVERERLVAEISRKVRSELDIDAVMRVAVTETGRALGGCRCFIRLGTPGEPLPVAAEWHEPELGPVPPEIVERLAVSNLAAARPPDARDRRRRRRSRDPRPGARRRATRSSSSARARCSRPRSSSSTA